MGSSIPRRAIFWKIPRVYGWVCTRYSGARIFKPAGRDPRWISGLGHVVALHGVQVVVSSNLTAPTKLSSTCSANRIDKLSEFVSHFDKLSRASCSASQSLTKFSSTGEKLSVRQFFAGTYRSSLSGTACRVGIRGSAGRLAQHRCARQASGHRNGMGEKTKMPSCLPLRVRSFQPKPTICLPAAFGRLGSAGLSDVPSVLCLSRQRH